jgi:hypothetical protein
MVSLRALPTHDHCSRVRVLPEFRADGGMVKRLVMYHRRSRMQTVVLNEAVLAVMYVHMMLYTGKRGLAPEILDDRYEHLR